MGYRAYCSEMGFAPVELEELTAQTVTEDFHGTLYSRAGVYGHKGDSITIYANPDDRLEVKYLDTGETSDSLYNLEYVDKKDKYSLFLNNLHPLIEITNEAAVTDRELVLIKVNAGQTERSDIMNIAEIMDAKILDISRATMTLELADTSERIDLFTELLRPFAIREIARTGTVALQKGTDTISVKK